MSRCTFCNDQPPFNCGGRWTESICPWCKTTWKMARHWERDGWRVTESKKDGGDLRAVDMVKDSGTVHGELYVRTWVSEELAALNGDAFQTFMVGAAEEELQFKLEEAETE